MIKIWVVLKDGVILQKGEQVPTRMCGSCYKENHLRCQHVVFLVASWCIPPVSWLAKY